MTRLQDNQRMEDEFLSSVAAEIEAEREQKAAMWEAMVAGHREYMDRRDDITTPETTYSFPPRTLSW